MKSIEEITNVVRAIVAQHSPVDSAVVVDRRKPRVEVRVSSVSSPLAELVWTNFVIRLIELDLLGGVLEAPLVKGVGWYAINTPDCVVVVLSSTSSLQ